MIKLVKWCIAVLRNITRIDTEILGIFMYPMQRYMRLCIKPVTCV